MTKILRRLYRGARWSEAYGSHPGWTWVVILPTIGAIAGAGRDRMLLGFVVMACAIVPVFLVGCWERGDTP